MRAITMMKRFLVGLLLAAGAAQAANSVTTYFHNDLAGSPVAASNESGVVIWREGFYPYGERLQKPVTDNRVWFTSRREDPETGLVYMGARYYDPVAGRFIQPDPVHFVETNVHSFNRYAYANNNPYKFTDPDGRQGVMAPVRPPPSTGTTLQMGIGGKPSQAQQLRQLEGFAAGPPMPTLSTPGFTSLVVDFALGGMPAVVKGVVSNLIFSQEVGGGASANAINAGDARRIQNAANRSGMEISVVGSRARGDAGPNSDWDYVVTGASGRAIHSIANSLPEGARGIGEKRNQDFHTGPLDKSEPHITFRPDR